MKNQNINKTIKIINIDLKIIMHLVQYIEYWLFLIIIFTIFIIFGVLGFWGSGVADKASESRSGTGARKDSDEKYEP